jgi:nucleotidyltransferase/DNA polymerase involved in DNA repair
VTQRGVKSVSNERTFREDLGKKNEVLKYINILAEKVSKRLKKKNLRGKTVQLKIRWSDFTTLTRQSSISKATNNFSTIQQITADLLISDEDILVFMKEMEASKILYPGRIELVDEIPLTAAGKADKKVLKKDIEEKLKKES